VPDRTANFPNEIEASKLAEYGFAVTSSETIEYQYTGWQNIDGATYYYDPATHQPVTGNQVIQGDVYTFGDSYTMQFCLYQIAASQVYAENPDFNAQLADGTTHFTDPGTWDKVLDQYLLLFKNNYASGAFPDHG